MRAATAVAAPPPAAKKPDREGIIAVLQDQLLMAERRMELGHVEAPASGTGPFARRFGRR